MKTLILLSTCLLSVLAFGQDIPVDLEKLASAGDSINKLDNLLSSAGEWASFLAEMLGALTVLATIIARKTKSVKDDEAVEGLTKFYLKAISYLPTLGVNPKTKRMEEELKELKKS